MKIGQKLILGFGLIVALFAAFVVFNYFQLQQIKEKKDEIVLDSDNAVLATEIHGLGAEFAEIIGSAIINQNKEQTEKDWAAKKTESVSDLDILKKIVNSKEEEEVFAKMMENYKLYLSTVDDKLLPLIFSGTGSSAEIEKIDAQLDGIVNDFTAALQKLQVSVNDELEHDQKDIADTIAAIILISIIIALVVLSIAVIIALVITNSITKPINYSADVLARVAKGDLTVTISDNFLNSKDEVGGMLKAMDMMITDLNKIASDIINGAENIAAATMQVAQSSQELSQRTSEQASSVEEISSSIEEMTATIRQNADNASQTEKIATKSSGDASESGNIVKQTVQAMNEIADKISIVQEIARQTNLLSLNASIEAARAGEHGKGFAVVASGVQKLAERSQLSATEIGKLAKTSVEIAILAGEMLTRLVPDIQKTSELVTEINAASGEQSSGVQQINNAIQQLNTVVQQNASSSEELASTSEEVTAQAQSLKETIGYFKISEEQHHTKAVTHIPRIGPKPAAKPTPTHIALHHDQNAGKGYEYKLGNPEDAEDEHYERF
jgi:methyl-accepting chemotaxis protein